MYMSMARVCILIRQSPVRIIAVVLAIWVLFFDVASVAAFMGHGRPSGAPLVGKGGPGNGRSSGPPAYSHGQGYHRADSGRGNGRSAPGGGGYYRGGRGPAYYRNDRGPGSYRGERFSPYGGPWRGGYGERRAVRSRGEAQRMLNDYYLRRSMRIGPLRENQFYFEADILDRNNRLMDRVIIDKRSGRIRSIY
jgi:hypothetical protein